MKVVWLVSADESLSPKLKSELDRTGVSYLVRHAKKVAQIPDEHVQSTGVAALVDSFHVEHTGFDGLKKLRERGFKGPIYMFGEPAPEKTTGPFTDLELSGFFPAIERADLSYIAGVVHNCFSLNEQLNLPTFLNSENKVGSAKISKYEDVEAISQKLSLFASRFGVKDDTLKKVIMGLCMGHIQTKHGESQIPEPFEIRFGTDRNKIVLTVPSHSKSNNIKVIRNEFAQALANFHNAELKNSALFQEFHHLVKAVNNLSIFGGSSAKDTEFPDPMFLTTRIQFGVSTQNDAHLGYYFSIHHTKPSESLDEATAHLPLLIDAEGSEQEAASSPKSNVTSHSEKDLKEILNDPVVVGDSPDQRGERIPLNTNSHQIDNGPEGAKLSEDEMIVNKNYLEKLKNDVKELKATNEALAEDIFKLMKERKEPALDTELRKQNEELKAKNEKLEADFDASIRVLQQQIDDLKNTDEAPSTEKKDSKKSAA